MLFLVLVLVLAAFFYNIDFLALDHKTNTNSAYITLIANRLYS